MSCVAKAMDRLPFELLCLIIRRVDRLEWPRVQLAQHTYYQAVRAEYMRMVRRRRRHGICEQTQRQSSQKGERAADGYARSLIRANHVDMLRWACAHLSDSTFRLPRDACNVAAKSGHVAILEWLLDEQEGFYASRRTYGKALQSGNVDLAQWLWDRRCPFVKYPYESAAKSGSTEMIEWVHAKHPTSVSGALVFDGAARCGHVQMLEWAHERGFTQQRDACMRAASRGHTNVLEWFEAKGYPSGNMAACAAAAKGGHLVTLQWLHEKGHPWNEETCLQAAGGGHLEVLEWARSRGCPWDGNTCAAAARNGHIEIVRWAREHGCSCDSWTLERAAFGGHVKLLEWLHDDLHIPWDPRSSMHVMSGAPARVLQWLAERGLIGDCKSNMPLCMCRSIEAGEWLHKHRWTFDKSACAHAQQLDILQWLRAHGCPWDERTCTSAAAIGRLDILQWARQNGCPWDEGMLVRAIKRGHMHIIEWAVENGCPWHAGLITYLAASYGDDSIARWVFALERSRSPPV